MRDYHDREWGVPLHGDRELFELLTLEGAQAGLSWRTILTRREGYRAAFDGFDLARIAAYYDDERERLRADERIIRNRAKIAATVTNARAALALRAEGTSLDALLWELAGGTPARNAFTALGELPAETERSRAMSKELRRRGFSFVGPMICYAFMQAAGMVNDHVTSCFRFAEIEASAAAGPRRGGRRTART
jgi:DNA-3-methyladenine glycosylase I